MKHLLLFSFLITTNAMAIDFNKVTGTFSEEQNSFETEEKSDLAFGSFDPKQETSRAPTSLEDQAQETTSFIEMTGTFEYQNN